MKKILTILSIVTISICFSMCLVRSTSGQGAVIYQRFQPTPEYLEARNMLEDPGSRSEGVQKLLLIGRANPRTTLGGKCMFVAAYYTEDAAQVRLIYQEVIRDYPGSVFEFTARESLVTLDQNKLSTAQRLKAYEDVLRSFHAPTLEDISRHPTAAIRHLRALPPELAQTIGNLYRALVDVLRVLKRDREALALAIFGREAFAYSTLGGKFSPLISHQFSLLNPNAAWGVGPPVEIQVSLNLREGQVVGGRPKIEVQAWTGDFTQAEVDLNTSDVTLDGQDIRQQLMLILKYPKKLKLGQIFEQMKFTYQPVTSLSPGLHTLRLRLQTGIFKETGIGQVIVTRTFRVDRHHSDDRDDDDDECDRERFQERDD